MLVLVVQLHVMGLAQSFMIVIVNMEYYIIVFIVRDSVFQLWIVSAELRGSYHVLPRQSAIFWKFQLLLILIEDIVASD